MFPIISFILSIAFIILQCYMLCHLALDSVLLRDSKKNWIIGFVLVGPIASTMYYFMEYRRY